MMACKPVCLQACKHVGEDEHTPPPVGRGEGQVAGQTGLVGGLVDGGEVLRGDVAGQALGCPLHAEARAAGRNIRVARMPMNYVARALEVDESRGFMKAVVDADSGQILGCAVLGIEGGEIMAMLEIAIMGKLPYTVLREAVFAHPTLAESLNNLFTMFDQ